MKALIQLTIVLGLPKTDIFTVGVVNKKFAIKLSSDFPPVIIGDTDIFEKPMYQKGKFGAYIVSEIDTGKNVSTSNLYNTRILAQECIKQIKDLEEPSDIATKSLEVYERTLETINKILD